MVAADLCRLWVKAKEMFNLLYYLQRTRMVMVSAEIQADSEQRLERN